MTKDEIKNEIIETLKIGKDLILQDSYFTFLKSSINGKNYECLIKKATRDCVYMRGIINHSNFTITLLVSFSVYQDNIISSMKIELVIQNSSRDYNNTQLQNHSFSLEPTKVFKDKEAFF